MEANKNNLSLINEMCYSRSIQISQKKQKENNLNKTKQKINRKIIETKVKVCEKRVQKKGINSSSKTTKISNTETSMQEDIAKNNHTANKTSDERARSLRQS